MRLLLYSGILYLAGVAIILTLKPEFMFYPDGTWKEFGIGRNPDRYTWFPFWIFALVWAVVSYILIIMLASFNLLPGVEVQTDGSIVNDRNLSGVVYSVGADEGETADEMRAMAEEMVEVPLKSPDVTPVITDLNDIGSRSRGTTAAAAATAAVPSGRRKMAAATVNMRNGYYLLNAEATRRSGIPKYVYLGPEPPKVLYR
jgi:hypothetical protein